MILQAARQKPNPSGIPRQFFRRNAVIVGVSKDMVESHRKFKAKHNLNFSLASDAETKTCEVYSVWKRKNMYGHTYMGIERSIFLIDERGIVLAEWRKVSAPGHVNDVAAAFRTL
jgi:peroxiredoxin Q/BCP